MFGVSCCVCVCVCVYVCVWPLGDQVEWVIQTEIVSSPMGWRGNGEHHAHEGMAWLGWAGLVEAGLG